MFRGFRLLKRYYNLANIKTSLLIVQFLFLLTPALLSILSPILLAEIISALTVYDFSKAIFFISFDFSIVIISSTLYFLYHIISRKINKALFYNFNDYLYENIKKNKNIKTINMPTLSNVSTCIEFNKNFLYKLCFLIKAIFTLAIIFYYHYIISLIIIIVSFISYLLLRITDKSLQMNTKHLSSIQQKSLDLFNNIHKGGDVEENYNLNIIIKNKYFRLVEDQIRTNNKISFLYSINNNFIALILKITVFIATIHLVGLIKSTFLTLSLYLILTPYLTSSAQNLISFFELFTEFGNIENILNEFESLSFKEEPQNNENLYFEDYNFSLYHVYSKNSILKDININVLFGEQVIIKSKDKSELHLLTKIINRSENISEGSIFIDNKNSSDIPIQIYRKIVSSTNDIPFFYNISLIENLIMVCSNKTYIKKIIDYFGLKSIIQKLQQKENTIIDDNFDKNLLFLLGILRSYLAGAKIICLEKVPNDLNENYQLIFNNILDFLKTKCSMIIFCQSPSQSFFKPDKLYTFFNGTLKESIN